MLVQERFKKGAPLNKYKRDLFYSAEQVKLLRHSWLSLTLNLLLYLNKCSKSMRSGSCKLYGSGLRVSQKLLLLEN